MAAIIYLDPEDEITSAAARIREARESRVVLVLPFGSRLATSRINFRLLAREAGTIGRRLDIVAPDAAARSIAASAGLAVYASVSELDDTDDAPGERATGPVLGPATPNMNRTDPDRGGAGLRETGGSGIRRTHETVPQRDADTDDEPEASPDAESGAGRWRLGFFGLGGLPTRSGVDPGAGRGRRDLGAPAWRRSGFRPSRLIAIGIAVLLIGGGGYAGWTLVPAADITIVPRVSPVGPLSVVVHADPAISAVDPSGGVIPATLIDIPVSVSDTFTATGKRIDESKAQGEVTFDSINTVAGVSVPKGTRVATLNGVVFATVAAIRVPQAKVSGNTITHGLATVGIEAVKAGTAANVAAGTITEVPGALATEQVSVSNPAATTGGTHTETPVVAQADVDGALSSLGKRLATAFTDAASAPTGVPEGATVFPATAVAGDAIPDPQPATLVGKEVASFDLKLSESGSMLAVDASPVGAIAEARLKARIDGAHTLVAGSVHVTVGEGTVADGVVSFTAQATGTEVLTLDGPALRKNVLGMSRAQAEAMLGQFGEVSLGLWPDWVADVPVIDGRVTLTVVGADGSPATPSPVPSGSPGS